MCSIFLHSDSVVTRKKNIFRWTIRFNCYCSWITLDRNGNFYGRFIEIDISFTATLCEIVILYRQSQNGIDENSFEKFSNRSIKTHKKSQTARHIVAWMLLNFSFSTFHIVCSIKYLTLCSFLCTQLEIETKWNDIPESCRLLRSFVWYCCVPHQLQQIQIKLANKSSIGGRIAFSTKSTHVHLKTVTVMASVIFVESLKSWTICRN